MENVKRRRICEVAIPMIDENYESLDDVRESSTNLVDFHPGGGREFIEILSDEIIVEGYETAYANANEANVQTPLVGDDEEQFLLLLQSWNVGDLFEIMKSYGISYDNLKYLEEKDYDSIINNDLSLLGKLIVFRHHHRQWKKQTEASVSGVETKAAESASNLKKILENGGKDGKKITKFFQENKYLTDVQRETLIHLIITKNNVLSRGEQKTFANQICTLFPGEKKNVYYQDPLPGKKNPTGLLYRRYNQMRAKSRSRDAVSESLSEEEQLNSLLDNVKESLEYLNGDTDNEFVVQHWNSTFEYRQLKIKNYENVVEAIEDWLPLQKVDGYLFIHFDFVRKYSEEIANNLKESWDNFFFRNFHLIAEGIKDPIARRSFQEAQSANDENIKNRLYVMALHNFNYMAPSTLMVNNRRWTPTIPNSKATFLNVINNVKQVEKLIKIRMKTCEEKNIKHHPVIFEIDNSREICYVVGIGNWQYECDSLIDAVDASLKIYDVLQIPYPPECSKVWKFLKEIFFENTLNGEISDKLTSLIDSFKRQQEH